MTVFLSQLRIRKDASLRTVMGLFTGNDAGAMDRKHKLLWSAFASDERRSAGRDFLYRSTSEDQFLTLSAIAPTGNELLEVVRTAPFDPDLKAGQSLRFALRGAASKSTFVPGPGRHQQGRGKRHCLLAAAHHAGIDKTQAVREWFSRQGEKSGFALTEDFRLDQDRTETIRPGVRNGVFDISGRLTVTDPKALRDVIVTGIGRYKGFGCGLMILGA